MLAALPADVRMSPSSVNSTPGSTWASGYWRGRAEHERAGAERDDPAPALVRLAQDRGHLSRDMRGGHGRQHDHRAGLADLLEAVLGQHPERAVGSDRAGGHAAHEQPVPGPAGRHRPVAAEDVAGHAQLERGHAVVHENRDGVPAEGRPARVAEAGRIVAHVDNTATYRAGRRGAGWMHDDITTAVPGPPPGPRPGRVPGPSARRRRARAGPAGRARPRPLPRLARRAPPGHPGLERPAPPG